MSEEFVSRAPGWSRRPPTGQTGAAWHMMRPSKSGRCKFLIVGHDLLGTDTHYWAGRTRPCIGEACEACNAQRVPRWHGYIAAIADWNKSQVIVEVTARMSTVIDAYFRAHRTLRGAWMQCERKSKKPNAATAIWLDSSGLNMDGYVQAPDVRPILERMWEVHSVQKIDAIVPKLKVLRSGTGGVITELEGQKNFTDSNQGDEFHD